MGSLFFPHLAAGMVLAGLLVERKATGRRFFTFLAGTALALLGLGIVMHPGTRGDASGPWAVLRSFGPEWAFLSYLVAGVLLCWYMARLPRLSGGRGQWLLGAAGFIALAGALLDALAFAPVTSVAQFLVWPLTFGVSALLLGSVTTAMTLGHFYLVIPGLSTRPLSRVHNLFGFSLLARLALFGLCVGIGWSPLPARFDLDAMMLAARVLVGFVAPLVLWVSVRETVKINSTQSATGILYAAVVVVMLGEAFGEHLAVVQRVLL